MAKRVLLTLVGIILSACATPQAELPTLMPSAPSVAEPTPTVEVIQEAPTPDFEALEATSQAISAPIQQALGGLADLQGVRSVSSMLFDDGAMVTVDANVAPADDNEDTMNRILAIVQESAGTLLNLRVQTWTNDVMQRTWLWENGAWSFTEIG